MGGPSVPSDGGGALPLRVVAASFLLALGPACGASPESEWPQWMGPGRDGVAAASAFFPAESEVELFVVWRRPLPGGYSLLTVAELKTGAEIWSRDLAATLGAVPPSYGMSTSPLLVDGRVVVLVGGTDDHNLVAFDQGTGEIAWSTHHAARGSYASPALWTVGSRRQIVVPADDRLYAVRPEDGELLWSYEGLGYLDRIPLRLPGDRIFLAQETRAVMLQLISMGSAWEVSELWRSRALKDSYSPALFHADTLFGFDGTFLTALDAESGEPRWRRQVGQGSLILVDGHLVILDALSGEVRLVRADPDEFLERARIPLFPNGGSYAPPSFAGGRIFVRGAREVAALAAVSPGSPPPR